MSAKRPSRQERRAAAKRQQRLTRESSAARVGPGSRAARDANRRSVSTIALGVGLVAIVALVYLPVHSYEFTSLDDPQYVSANAVVAQGLTWTGFRWAFSAEGGFYWHPLTWLSHMLDVQLFGMRPGPHHTVNVLIHAANGVLLFGALNRMTGARARSLFVAALFAVHPLHVESVAWVAERKDVLSTFFWMAVLYAYSGYVADRRMARWLSVVLLFAAGLLAKPMIVTLPFVLLLLDYWPLGRVSIGKGSGFKQWVPVIREKLPLFCLAAASVIMTMLSQRGSGAVVALEKLPVISRTGNALVSYVDYMRDMFWPAGLAAFYPLLPPSGGPVIIAAAVVAAITALAIRTARSFPYFPVGWLWYVGTLLPVVGLVQAGDQGRADRFTYVPLIGLFIAIAWAATDLTRRFRHSARWLPAAAIAIVAALAVAARTQVTWWKNDLALWGRAVQVTRGSYRAENHYGVALTDQGRLDEGIQHYIAALAIWPDYPEAHNNLGTARVEQGRVDDALREFSEAARLKPGSSIFHYNLGVTLSMKGDTAAAIRAVSTAVRLAPGNSEYARALQILGGGAGESGSGGATREPRNE